MTAILIARLFAQVFADECRALRGMRWDPPRAEHARSEGALVGCLETTRRDRYGAGREAQ